MKQWCNAALTRSIWLTSRSPLNKGIFNYGGGSRQSDFIYGNIETTLLILSRCPTTFTLHEAESKAMGFEYVAIGPFSGHRNAMF